MFVETEIKVDRNGCSRGENGRKSRLNNPRWSSRLVVGLFSVYRQVRRWPLAEIDTKQTGRSGVARGLSFCLCYDTVSRRLYVG